MAEDFTQVFDQHFQTHFVNHMLRDSGFLEYVAAEVKAELFSTELLQRAVRLILNFQQENNAAPNTLIFRYLDSLKEKGRVAGDAYKSMNEYLDMLFTLPLQNRSFLLREFDKFLRHQMFR